MINHTETNLDLLSNECIRTSNSHFANISIDDVTLTPNNKNGILGLLFDLIVN